MRRWRRVRRCCCRHCPSPPRGLAEATITIDGTAHPVRNLMLRQTQLFNVTGHPAVSLPTGVGENGLPVGLQVVGRHHETNALMQTALAIELALLEPRSTDNLLT